MIGQIIGMIIVGAIIGAIIGALARLFLKGDQHLSVLWTIILGALGAAAGSWLAGVFGVAQTSGVDWIRWILSIVFAMIFISIFIGVTRRK